MPDLEKTIEAALSGYESAYSHPTALAKEMDRLIRYAIDNRDDREVRADEMAASLLISEVISSLGFTTDINIGRDIWELVSEDSQAQWLTPPECWDGVIISLVNVAENMSKSQCYIEFP